METRNFSTSTQNFLMRFIFHCLVYVKNQGISGLKNAMNTLPNEECSIRAKMNRAFKARDSIDSYRLCGFVYTY